MAERLFIRDWTNILRNVREGNEEVEVTWLDPGDSSEGEWCLNSGCELFEDGFKTEQDAIDRLAEIEKAIDTNRGWQVLGYFTDRDENTMEPLDHRNVMVVIEDTALPSYRVTVYTPAEQHTEVSWEYIENMCKPISKKEYMEVGKDFFTPAEYL